MHLTFRHMSALLLILYLFVPVMGFAHAGGVDVWVNEIGSHGGVASVPCDGCPCNDGQGSHCCDSDFCCCAFHCPPVQGIQVRYEPVEVITRHAESFRMPPQIYLSIFVPPQNRLPDFS